MPFANEMYTDHNNPEKGSKCRERVEGWGARRGANKI